MLIQVDMFDKADKLAFERLLPSSGLRRSAPLTGEEEFVTVDSLLASQRSATPQPARG